MNINDIFWPDSSLIRLSMEDESLHLTIHNAVCRKTYEILCSGFAGITEVILWDDVILANLHQEEMNGSDAFLQKLIAAYGKNANIGGKKLSDIRTRLTIQLISGFSFSVYCHAVLVQEAKE